MVLQGQACFSQEKACAAKLPITIHQDAAAWAGLHQARKSMHCKIANYDTLSVVPLLQAQEQAGASSFV